MTKEEEAISKIIYSYIKKEKKQKQKQKMSLFYRSKGGIELRTLYQKVEWHTI